ncbi:hypothetical protein P152DRAFT_457340 [Eremomyces bilateralis CBS 781.70]|uniref:Nucleic acid-binding protein n=1 Tax=Eremomyces bilateralis CBS 781.70 TaxID=1392243 RepID=A0A6G1G7R9_9PEZI|nr:uncharacterized protein P152DRAFT_457340 [Eremomyces bilateralis CBS 781.70]KAF1813971.1 hypothetical protein P152DRAFT_457340 [Eremomyces bilateralis CBS 781.70]
MSATSILLTGAPTWADLDWDEAGLLKDSDLKAQLSAIRSPSPARPRWRTLGLADLDITTTRPVRSGLSDAATRRNRHVSSNESVGEDEELGDDAERTFLDDSFAIHEEFDDQSNSSILATEESSFRATGDSSTSAPYVLQSSPITAAHLSSLPRILDLSALPTATHVFRSRHGPCLSVIKAHLLVAVVAMCPPKAVTVRSPQQRGQRMEIVELEVADETAGRFRISFWFEPSERGARREAGEADMRVQLRRQVETLEMGDMVLLTDIALNVFNGRVCGQSVRGWGNRAGTKLYHLSGVDVVPGASPITEKLQRVNRWQLEMLDPRKRNPKRRWHESLPPDTQ